ncbi:MAG: hypothetical protein ACJAXA_003132 [Candidatus Aldehydirespiratoraceae bacterium]|jgi:hypothetical protein
MTVDVTPIAVRCATQNGSSGSSDVQDEDPQRDHQGGQYAVRRTQNDDAEHRNHRSDKVADLGLSSRGECHAGLGQRPRHHVAATQTRADARGTVCNPTIGSAPTIAEYDSTDGIRTEATVSLKTASGRNHDRSYLGNHRVIARRNLMSTRSEARRSAINYRGCLIGQH